MPEVEQHVLYLYCRYMQIYIIFFKNYQQWTNEIRFSLKGVSFYCTRSTGRHGLEFLFYIQYLYDHHCRLIVLKDVYAGNFNSSPRHRL